MFDLLRRTPVFEGPSELVVANAFEGLLLASQGASKAPAGVRPVSLRAQCADRGLVGPSTAS
eukprot:2014638-Lingulodinium_polyedra.AAC.1